MLAGDKLVIPSILAPRRQTSLLVKWKRRANTRAWTAATVSFPPFLGRRRRTPGVKMKKRMAA